MVEQPLTVLVVEDDEAVAGLVRITLEGAGFSVRTVSSALRALDELDAAAPDVLLLDLMLPDMDGLELCSRVRERDPAGPYLPVVVLTALSAQSHKQLGFARGADDYVTKPFDLSELLARVRAWGLASRRIRELHATRERLLAERQAAQDQAIRHMALAIPDAINQSLSEVYGYAELLANRPDADPAVRELQQRIRVATEHLVEVVDQLANAVRYVTKNYGQGMEMLDVNRAAEAPANFPPR